MSDSVIIISSDEAESTSSESVARPNNDVHIDNQSSSGSPRPSTSGTVKNTPKRKRKRKPKKYGDADEDSDDLEVDKDFRYQIRDRLNSDSFTQRRSPRNTPEARESRSRSLSLGISDEHSQGEDIYAKLQKRQQQVADTSLAEINRKILSVSWKPLD